MPIRVISGRFGGRKLASLPGTDTRPSSGRMRLAVQNLLGPGGSVGASVLDLYAGTGASGIEALSCGAVRALFIERARPAREVLERNIETLGLKKEEARVFGSDVISALLRGVPLDFEPYDLVFCDPPYEVFRTPVAERSLRDALGVLNSRGGLAPGARVIVEHPEERGFGAPPAGLVQIDRRRYSAAGVTIYGRA